MSKKDFTRNNPALDFISRDPVKNVEGQIQVEGTESEEEPTPTQQDAPTEPTERMYPGIAPIKKETRSSKMNLLVTPTTHQKMKEIAEIKGQSMNGLINNLFAKYIQDFEKENQ